MSESYVYGLPAHDVTRDIFFSVADNFGITKWGVLVLFAGSLAILAFTIIWKMVIWAKGKNAPLPGILDTRVFAVIRQVFLQQRIIKDWFPGIAHASIFYGFLGIIVLSLVAAVQEYVSFLFFDCRFLTGYAYLAWSFLGDMCALLVLFGCALSIVRRWILRPPRLDTKIADIYALGIIIAVVGSGLLVNAARIAICGYPAF
ncbi:MAG: hypothetical protein ACRCUT_06250, partial [Spirochaetota bacterium]